MVNCMFLYFILVFLSTFNLIIIWESLSHAMLSMAFQDFVSPGQSIPIDSGSFVRVFFPSYMWTRCHEWNAEVGET